MITGLFDEVFARSDASGVHVLAADALGSTLALTDGGGATQTQYTYEPFGSTTASGVISTNPVQYTGRDNDGANAYFYRARYFNPSTQRFLSEDPLGISAGDTNLFAYVHNAPTRYTDPSGMFPMLRRPGWFPSCDRLQASRKPTAWDRFWCGVELGSVLPTPAGLFSKAEAAGLRALLGDGVGGAENLLKRLLSGERVALPEGVTADLLRRYLERAREMVNASKDLAGTQAVRIAAIEALLQQLGLK
jgi:RHS repeat-associated protein